MQPPSYTSRLAETNEDSMGFQIDPIFSSHFKRLKQVFLYINDQCNITCEQCIYKPNVTFHDGREIPPDTAIALGKAFYHLGARKLTILGGEPTLYGLRKNREPLFRVIAGYRNLGYSYLRLDTNGQFVGLLEEPGFRELDEVAFSIDGYNPETNDPVRGNGTFRRVEENLRRAVTLGYRTTITCCLHRGLFSRDDKGRLGVENMIRFAEARGVAVINFHDLFKAGVPMDAWTGKLDTSVEEHVAMYDELAPRIRNGDFRISVRLPQCFVTHEEFERNPKYYGYCPVKLGERVMVHTSGVIRICSNLICSEFGVGRFYDNHIVWDSGSNNETGRHELHKLTPCTNRSRNKRYGKYVPLCFSFKPDQDEYVWQQMLGWDDRRIEPAEIEAFGVNAGGIL